MWIDDVRSVAIVGASELPSKVGGKPLDYLLRYGFPGRIYPVNPTKDTIQGLRAYPSVGNLPEAPDLVIVAVPAKMVLAVVEDSVRIQAGHVIIFSSGFGELGAEGREIEDKIASIAASSKTRILGPNCQGIVSPRTGLYATFSSVYVNEPAPDGGIAILSQSGAVAAMTYSTLRDMGRGIRLLCATGNEVDVDVFDLALEIADEECTVVALYAEQIRDPWLALAAMRRLISSGKRVVLLRAGQSAAGRRAAASHTGSLTSDDEVLLQAFVEAGVVMAHDVQELAIMASLGEQPLPRGRRAAIVSNSGGLAVTIVDQMEALGLSVPPPSERLRQELAQNLPEFIIPGNPADLSTLILERPQSIGQIVESLATSGEYDIVVSALGMVSVEYDRETILDGVAEAAQRSPSVLVTSLWVGTDPILVSAAGERGMFSTNNVRVAVDAIASAAEAREARRGGRVESADEAPALGQRTAPEPQDEYTSKLALESILGTPTSARFVHSIDDVVQADISWPAALKVCDKDLLHKSDGGFVELSVPDASSAATSLNRMSSSFERAFGRMPRGFVIEPMASGGYEMFIGLTHNDGIGYSLLVGAGGVDVEFIDDTVSLLPPFTDEYVRERLRSLRCWTVLEGGRSGPYDIDAFVRLITSIDIDTVIDLTIEEIDINPVIVHRTSHGVSIVDATVVAQTPFKEVAAASSSSSSTLPRRTLQ